MGEIKYYISTLGGSNSIADLADAFRGGGGLGKDTNGILEYVHSITGDALTLSATGGWGLESTTPPPPIFCLGNMCFFYYLTFIHLRQFLAAHFFNFLGEPPVWAP